MRHGAVVEVADTPLAVDDLVVLELVTQEALTTQEQAVQEHRQTQAD